MRLALALAGVLAAIAVTGASAADFEGDTGPCKETPGEPALLRCPTGYVGVPYEAIEIETEEGSGCFPHIWMKTVNSAPPAGLSMSRSGVISGVPTGAGLGRFWVHNHDLTAEQGGPSWCERDDVSEREFSIPIAPGLAIVTASVKPATLGEPYSEMLAAMEVRSLTPLGGPDARATWSLQSGVVPPGLTLSTDGVLSGTPTADGSYQFVVRAQSGDTPVDTETYTLVVRQPVVMTLPFGSAQPSAEVGLRFGKTVTATGGTGTYTWSLASGALPSGLALDAITGTISGTPGTAGNFAFALTAIDGEGRAATLSAALVVAPKLTIKSVRLKTAQLARGYSGKLAAVGGVQPVNWSIVRGKLPPGVRLAKQRGVLAGTPRRAGAFSLTVEARDALGAKSQKALVLLVKQ